MQITLAQCIAAAATAGAAWLMVQAGVSKGALKLRVSDRCASCGRLVPVHRRCTCSTR
jgi:acyl-coenzyme A synthetase/AMP-(fatty) acid ligase